MIFATSDPHYGHKKVIEYCNRPFIDIEHMKEMLIQNFNSVVSPVDTTYFLGDVFFMGTIASKEILSRLNGIKISIRGNHDHKVEKMLNIGFSAVLENATIMIGKERVKMSHYPYKPNFDGINQIVIDDLLNNLRRQRETGKDSTAEIDELLGLHLSSGTLSKEQFEYLTNMDCRYLGRRFQDDGGWLLCGHVHEKWDQLGKMINVGVDVRGFKPISIVEIEKIINAGAK